MHRIALITLAALLTTACASSKRVVVDKQGIDEAQYQQDLTDCRAVADEVSTGRDSAEGAAGGAVIGAAGKAGDAEQEKSQVVKNCMRGRGYRVLN